LEKTGNIAKSSKFQSKTLLLGVLLGMIMGFKLYRKKNSSKLNTIFKIVEMNFGSKSGAWVSFDRFVAVLQISKKLGANSFSTPLVN